MPAGTLQTLLTCHKGVDLHAATARRVMRERLTGGDLLVDLRRCEFHVFGGAVAFGAGGSPDAAALLATGRYYNPNKHRVGHFGCPTAFAWDEGRGGALPADWPGEPVTPETAAAGASYADLLGGPVPRGHAACDVATWSRGQQGGVISGTLWRLVIRGDEEAARTAGPLLAVARGGREGLLVNPHMDCWLFAFAADGS